MRVRLGVVGHVADAEVGFVVVDDEPGMRAALDARLAGVGGGARTEPGS